MMTKRELALILNNIEKVRNLLTPQQAEQVPYLFPKLPNELPIKQGQRFNIEGTVFEALVDIESEEDMDPVTSNKWSRPTQKGGR